MGEVGEDRRHEVDIGAVQHPVAGDIGDEQVAHCGELAEHVGERPARSDFPAVGRDQRFAVVDPDIERQRETIGAEAIEHRAERGGIGQRKTADDDSRDASVEHRCDLVGGAEAPRDLKLERGRSGQRGEQIMLARGTGAGAVEIDQMRFLRAARGEVGERGSGVVRIRRLARKIALREPHAAAADEVDGG